MQLNEIFSNFNVGKGMGKFILGALATGLAYLVQNPETVTQLIPSHIATMTIGGLALELIDYLLLLIKKATAKPTI